MKFKLVENYDQTRWFVQEYAYEVINELGNASLEEYIQWFMSEFTYFDDKVKQAVKDFYIEAIDCGKINLPKTMITSELTTYLESNVDLIDTDINELINNCPDHLKHELTLVLDRIDDSLNEELLTESTTPTYREMFLELLEALSENSEFKQLLKKNSELNIHHIDSTYNEKRRAINNHPSNIAIMSKAAHQELTKLNKQSRKELSDNVELHSAFRNNFDNVKEQFPGEVFDIYTCLPDFAVEIILNNNITELV